MNKATKIAMSATIIFLTSICSCQILFDPFASYRNRQQLDDLQVKLDAAKAKWNSDRIESYSYEVQYIVPMWGFCGAKITVKQGKLVEVTEIIHGRPDKLPTPIALTQDQWDQQYCDYSNDLTIPEAFKNVQIIINANWSLHVSFDQTFGFVTNYYGSPNINMGLLDTYWTESEFNFTFSNFQRLDIAP